MRIYLLSTLALAATLSVVGCGSDDGGEPTVDPGADTGSTDDTGGTADDTGATGDDTGGTTDDTGTPTDTGSPADTGTGSDAADTGPSAPTFTQVWNVLNTQCGSCHRGGSPDGRLDMSNKNVAYTNLVGKAAAGSSCSGKGTRVVAGNAAMSILYTKVTTPTCGARMPSGRPALSMTQTNMIRDWINAGALNN